MSDNKLNNSINNRGYLVTVLIFLIVLYALWRMHETGVF